MVFIEEKNAGLVPAQLVQLKKSPKMRPTKKKLAGKLIVQLKTGGIMPTVGAMEDE
jgi:hypothetical protein